MNQNILQSNKLITTIDYTLIALGTTWSLDNIESILGIIVLAIQILWLLAKFIIKLVQVAKTSNIENVTENMDKLDKDVNEIIDSINKVIEDTGGETDGNKE